MSASTYTFLFTDIEGSTHLWESNPESARAAVEKHNLILRRAIESRGGRVFRTAGDAFYASFKTAAAALEAAVDAQRNLHAENWEQESSLRVRMALHSGAAEEQDGDYVGASLNRIGRLISHTHGGQILMTQATQELVRDTLPEEVTLLDLGRHRFRDLVYPEQVYQAAIAGLPDKFPPLKSLESIPNNLPSQLTSFIGRVSELAKAVDLLENTRLLTLTGPGGTGKTRLALQVASSLLETFTDGVWVIELAPISDPDLVLSTIAEVLNIREHSEIPLAETVSKVLHTRRLLIILDNCEHLIEECTKIADKLLRACPGLKIIASSREVLDIQGETIMRVPALSLPPILETINMEEIKASEAVQLFLERAKAVQPSFSLTPQNAAAVVKICHRLDGIPLAIELAAARVRILQLEQIASRLDDQFRLLTGRSRAVVPRQQTLEATIDWSYNLLSPEEQALFRRLAVFSGGWSLEASESVCGPGGLSTPEHTSYSPPLMVLELLTQLVNKSLVLVEELGVEYRYGFLETIRQYAQIKLAESGEARQIRQQHLQYFRSYSSQARDGLRDQEQLKWMERLDRDHDNLRSAMEWGLENDLWSALELGANLDFFWSGRGYSSEGRRRLQAGLDRMDLVDASSSVEQQRIHARVLSAYGLMAFRQGENATASRSLEQAVQIQRNMSDISELVLSIALLCQTLIFLGEIERARDLAEEGEVLSRLHNQPIGLGFILNILAQISIYSDGDYNNALEKVEESARLLSRNGNRWFTALSFFGLGILTFFVRDLDRAGEYLRESYENFKKAGDIQLATAARGRIADVARLKGEREKASTIYHEVLHDWLSQDHRGGVARCLECFAFLYVVQAKEDGQTGKQALLEKAAELLGAAETIREASKAEMTFEENFEYQEQVSDLHTQYEKESGASSGLDIAWKKGRSLTQDKALALVC